VLVDPCGVIVWQGNPADVPVERIEELLEDVLPEPAHRWPASAVPVREALRGSRYDDAARLAQALPNHGPRITELVGRIVARRVELMEHALGDQDFLTAEQLATDLETGLAAGPLRARASAVRAEIAASPEALAILEVQRRLLELWSRVRSVVTADQAEELAKDIRALAKTKPGTKVERTASSYLETLAVLKTSLR
jgi:hypothetical protein